MKVLLLCVMVLMAGMSQLEATREERPRVLCGRNLADARMLYCFSQSIQKRADLPMIYTLYPQDDDEMSWMPHRQAQEQALALDARRKRMPGLVDECCLKACYISELLNYC